MSLHICFKSILSFRSMKRKKNDLKDGLSYCE